MAGSIKGIVVEIGGDTVGLNKALSDTSKEINSTQKELKAVERALKLDPKNVELLKQKQELFAKSVKQTEAKVEALKAAKRKADADMKNGTEVNEEQYRKLVREISFAESSLKNLRNTANSTSQSVGKVTDNADKGSLTGAIATGNILANGVSALGNKLVDVVKDTREYRREIGYLKTNCEQANVSFDEVNKRLNRVTAITDDSGAAVEGFSNLLQAGFSEKKLDQITNNLVGAAIKWKDTLKFEGLADGLQETLATGAATGPFGEMLERLGMDLGTFNEGLNKCTTSAEKQQYVLDTLVSSGLAEVKKEYEQTNAVLIENAEANADLNAKLSELSEKIEPILTQITDVSIKVVDWVNNNSELAAGLGGTTLAIVGVTKGIKDVKTVAEPTKKAIEGLSKAFKTMGKSSIASLGLVGVAIAGIAAFVKTLEGIRKNENKEITNKYSNQIKQSNKSFDTEISNLKKSKSAAENKYNSESKKLNEFYDKKIKGLSNDLKLQKKAIEEEKKACESAHKERLSQLEKERNAKLSVINLERDQKTAALQAQIDALDEQTETEEKIKEEQENAQKLTDLKQSILTAKTYAEKVEAQKNYTAEVKKQEEARIKKAREEQKKQLQDKINTLNIEAQKRTEEVNKEYNEAVQLENDKTTAAQEGFKDRLEALDGYVQRETERLEALRQSNLGRMQKETTDYCDELQKRIDKETELKKAAQKRIEAEEKARLEETKWPNFFRGDYWSKKRERQGGGLSFWDTVWENVWGNHSVGKNAKGTNDWRGGLTYVHEQGGELINLPQHTQIIPHDLSVEYMKALAKAPTTTNNNYGARQQVNVLSIGGQEVARVIQPTVSVGSANQTYGRRRAGYVRK